MQNETKDSFELLPQQRDILFEAMDLLKMAKSYIYSAWNSSDFSNPIPHNQYLNQVIEEHNLDMEKMPEIDDDVAKASWQYINDLLAEIGEYDESTKQYTPGSWLYWD
jgi:hypothetical protein